MERTVRKLVIAKTEVIVIISQVRVANTTKSVDYLTEFVFFS